MNCSSAIEKQQQQQAAFHLRSFGASNLKRAAFFFNSIPQEWAKVAKGDSEGSLSNYFWNTPSIFMALRGRKRSTQLQQCHRKAAAAAGCLSFKEFWGVQFEKGCFLFWLQRVFGQWRNSWGASLPAIYILHPLCEAQTFNGTFPQLEIYCAAACLLLHNRAKPFWKVFLSLLSACRTSRASRNRDW